MKVKTMFDKDRLYKMSIVDTETMCWNWIGTLKGTIPLKQYGSITIGSRLNGTRKQMSAHRFSYQVFKGEIPDDMFVCHKCDNPKCINPNHLFLGTRQDNVDDREAKGRNKIQSGENHGKSKLTEEQVLLIRQLKIDGIKRNGIQKQTGISSILIKEVLLYRTWKNILPKQPKS
jgi:hypothetical protein